LLITRAAGKSTGRSTQPARSIINHPSKPPTNQLKEPHLGILLHVVCGDRAKRRRPVDDHHVRLRHEAPLYRQREDLERLEAPGVGGVEEADLVVGEGGHQQARVVLEAPAGDAGAEDQSVGVEAVRL